jgi:hypothetical protein
MQVQSMLNSYEEGIQSAQLQCDILEAYNFVLPGLILYMEQHAAEAGTKHEEGSSSLRSIVITADASTSSATNIAHKKSPLRLPSLPSFAPHRQQRPKRFKPRWVDAVSLRDAGLVISKSMFVAHSAPFQLKVCVMQRGRHAHAYIAPVHTR